MRSLILTACALLPAALGAQPGKLLVDPAPLASRSVRSFEPFALSRSLIASPRLISRHDRTVLSWIEPDEDGRDRLYSFALRDERQQDYPLGSLMAPIDQSGSGHVTSAAVSLSNDGRESAWAWLTANGDAQELWVRREGRVGSAVAQTTGLIEFPALCFDAAGNVYASWTEQVGGRPEVWVATQTASGDAWVSRQLSSHEGCDLLPQLFGGAEDARLLWYGLKGSGIALFSATVSQTAEPSVTMAQDVIPAYRLPILFRSGGETPGALWLEPVDGGEVYMILDPRSASFPRPEMLGGEGQRPLQAAVSQDDSAAFCWVNGSDKGAEMVAQNPHGAKIVLPLPNPVVEPQSAVSRGWTNLAWVESDPETGLGTLWFYRAR